MITRPAAGGRRSGSFGRLEYWSGGVKERWSTGWMHLEPNTPILQYSHTPTSHSRCFLLIVQLPGQEICRKAPSRFSQDRIVAFAIGHRESVAGAMEEVPIQRLSVGLQTRH